MWNEIQSVSETIAKREKPPSTNFRLGGVTEGKLNRVKLAWLTPSAKAQTESKSNGKLRALVELLRLYCDNSSLVGYKYITEIRRAWFERIMWIILHAIMIFTLGTIVWSVLQDYKHTPVVTVVDSEHYSSKNLIFPAISVCNINRMSRKAVARLAERIQSSNITKLPSNKIVKLLHELGNLYESSFDVYNKTQDELDELLKKYFRGNYELTELMKELTPQCSDLFVKCRFRMKTRNCSELFSFRKTQDGFCCTFNYARESDDIHGEISKNYSKEPYKIKKLGFRNGLTFLMEPFLEDYFFPILPVRGWKITIFNPSDYPDNTSGGVSDALISPGTENFLELNAVSFFSEKAVRYFDIEERKCIFNDELSALYEGYTYSDCIVDCKVNDIWETCGCRPFFYPERNTQRVCNTSDVQCLNKFKSKWWSVLPHDIKQGGEESKIFNFISNESWSLRCKNCYPSCDDIRYYLQASSVNLDVDEHTRFLGNISLVNRSLVHIFFAKYGTVRLKQDITFYWYELLSNIGGLCGVFIGFSLISAIELIYFLVLSGTTLLTSNTKFNSAVHDTESMFSRDMRSLYWSELVPRSKANLLLEDNSKMRVHSR